MIGALIGAGASLLGGSMANKFSAGQTKSQFARQLYLSSTAHQREVEDLKKAGLNPILSAGGSGAPMGATSAATSANLGQNISSGAQAGAQVGLNRAQTNATKAQAEQTRIDTKMKKLDYKIAQESYRKLALTSELNKAGVKGIRSWIGTIMDALKVGTDEDTGVNSAKKASSLIPISNVVRKVVPKEGDSEDLNFYKQSLLDMMLRGDHRPESERSYIPSWKKGKKGSSSNIKVKASNAVEAAKRKKKPYLKGY